MLCYNRGMSEKRYMTVQEAAQELNLSTDSIYVMLDQGKFPGARKWGRDWQIPIETIELNRVRRKRGRPKKTAS